jgi:hypothetical protein
LESITGLRGAADEAVFNTPIMSIQKTQNFTLISYTFKELEKNAHGNSYGQKLEHFSNREECKLQIFTLFWPETF